MTLNFNLKSNYKPSGDQPEAISNLVDGIKENTRYQVLEGVTGSGKTFTAANVIQEINQPTLVIAHNKTLAAQLYKEFKEYFPENLVEYFVSYYDYYQPEAYIPVTNTYIEKDLSINEEIEKLRLSATTSLLSGRKDVIVVASVSCLYGIGNPVDYKKNTIYIDLKTKISRTSLLKRLSSSLYSRSTSDLSPGNFRVTGDVVDISLSYRDCIVRVNFFGDEIESIDEIHYAENKKMQKVDSIYIYPANMFSTQESAIQSAITQIQLDLGKQIDFFKFE